MTVAPLILASPATLSELVSRLPAAARARLSWAPRHLTDMAERLLTIPLVTDGAIDTAGGALLEVSRALALELPDDLPSHLETDLNSLHRLALVNAKAAVRATATVLVAGQLGPALVRAAALLIAVFEGLRRGSPVPGRVDSLARRADEAASAFAASAAAERDGVQLPWYVATAAGAEVVASFAAWSPANRPSLRKHGQPTQEELSDWERVKAALDSARPHRKLFTASW